MPHRYKGKLITLEGIDGSGKSTLAKNLFEALQEKNLPVILTKEPGGSTLGKSLRKILQQQNLPVCSLSEYLLFAADRAQHFEELIIPALEKDCFIISDRMGDSSLAYQGYGRGLDKDMIMRVNQWAMHTITPDLTIYLKIDPETSLNRVLERNETLTAIEKEKMDFWKHVYKGYENIFTDKDNVVILDGTLSQDQLLEQTLEKLLILI